MWDFTNIDSRQHLIWLDPSSQINITHTVTKKKGNFRAWEFQVGWNLLRYLLHILEPLLIHLFLPSRVFVALSRICTLNCFYSYNWWATSANFEFERIPPLSYFVGTWWYSPSLSEAILAKYYERTLDNLPALSSSCALSVCVVCVCAGNKRSMFWITSCQSRYPYNMGKQ